MKNKKIGIITLYYKNNNYGGVAQAYALCKYFEKIGFNAEMITYLPRKRNDSLGVSKKINAKKIILKLKNMTFTFLENTILKKQQININLLLSEREKKLENFRESIPHSIVYNYESIHNIENKYQYFVTGSDQCWNPGVIDDPYVFSFLDKKNKSIFSYASSIAVSELSERYMKYMEEELVKYDAISVREKESKIPLSNITSKDVKWVIDPTLLLNTEDWENITSKKLIEHKYIFCYFLGNDLAERKLAKRISKKLKLPLVTLPFIKSGNKFKFKIQDYKFGNQQMIDIGFEDFLSLIKYAEYVITDSFHAVCFSYIFKKEFFAIEKKSLISTSSRIKNLLEVMEIPERLIKNEKQIYIKKINYNKVKNKIDIFKKESIKYLKQAINDGDKHE